MAKIEQIKEVALVDLVPYSKNAKRHSEDQIKKICDSIEEFGFLNPCLIDKDNNIIAGHGRVMACKELGWDTVPCIYVEGLSEEQYKAYVLADNRLTELGDWDMDMVQEELEWLNDMDFDISLTGFELENYDFESIDTEDYGDAKSFEHFFSVDKKKFAITDEEYDLLINAIEKYSEANGVMFGFVSEVFNG